MFNSNLKYQTQITKTRTMKKLALCLAAAGFIVSNANAISFTVFTDRALWEEAVASFTEETFGGAVTPDFTHAAIGSGHNGYGISSGRFNDRLTSSNSTLITFLSNIVAFGANWNLAPGGEGLGIVLSAGGSSLPSEIPSNYTGQFFGFVADESFNQVTLTAGTQSGSAETYNTDNFVYASKTASVPDAGTTSFLLGIGLSTLFAIRRRFSTKP